MGSGAAPHHPVAMTSLRSAVLPATLRLGAANRLADAAMPAADRLAVCEEALALAVATGDAVLRLEAEELEWTMERVEVRELVQDAVEAMRPAADAGSVAVHAHVDGSQLCSHGNREQLSRVLFNLIQNAIHHTPPDGSVTWGLNIALSWRSTS